MQPAHLGPEVLKGGDGPWREPNPKVRTCAVAKSVICGGETQGALIPYNVLKHAASFLRFWSRVERTMTYLAKYVCSFSAM